MTHDLLRFLNMDPENENQDSLRLALMFQNEVDEATRAYMEILQMTIDASGHTSDEITQLIQEAINAALLSGIRAYRSWIETQGIDVQAVEKNSGKDIPPDYLYNSARWPL